MNLPLFLEFYPRFLLPDLQKDFIGDRYEIFGLLYGVGGGNFGKDLKICR